MQETFEYIVQKKFDYFKIEPSGQTWMEIEKALHPRHEKRGIFWWWVPLAGIIVAGLIVWNLYNKKTSTQKNIPVNDLAIRNDSILSARKKITETEKDTSQKFSTVPLINTTQKRIEKNGFCKITHKAVTIDNAGKKTKNAYQSITDEYSSDKEEKDLNSKNKNGANNNNIVKKENGNFAKISTIIGDSDITTTNKIVSKQSVTKTNPSVSLTKQATSNTKNNNKKSKWFIVGEGGVLSINSNVFPSSKSLPTYLSSMPSSVGNSFSQTYTTNASKGFGFALGIHRQSQISGHWSFETGLMYRYFQNEQSAGIKSGSLYNLSGSLLSTNYYQAGNINSITNYTHSISIPLLFNYTIHLKQKNKFYLQAGFEGGYSFAKKWLITDETLNGYYYRSSLLNDFQLNGLLGVGINFKNYIKANINFRQALTPLYKINTDKYYTSQISLQVLIPFSLKNRK